MEKKILPPNYFCFLLMLLIITHFIFQKYRFLTSSIRFSGILLIFFGIFIDMWADSIFKKSKTTVKPNEIPSILITTGPFRISRHPMYLGMILILLGSSIICGTVITLIYPIIFLILMEIIFIPVEENNLIGKFGEDYIIYKKRTRRWI